MNGRDTERRDISFAAYVSGSASSLTRTAFLLTGDFHKAQDLVQNALAKAYLKWGRIEGVQHPDAYVRRILINEHLAQRRLKRPLEVSLDMAGDPGAGQDAMADADVRSLVRAAINLLPRKQRAAVILRYYEDWTDHEIATALSCSENTVRSQLSRAMSTLRHAACLDELLRTDQS